MSALTGNIVHWTPCLNIDSNGMRVLDCKMASMSSDKWKCGTPIHRCNPLTINVSIAKIKASGGTLSLSTWDGNLLQDDEVIPYSCNLFKLVFMKQVGKLSVPNSGMMNICADTAGLGQMSPQDAHSLDTLSRRVFSRIQQLPMGMHSPEPSIVLCVAISVHYRLHLQQHNRPLFGSADPRCCLF